MIDEEETYRRLKPQSNKRIVAVCEGCGKVREVRKYGYHALCLSCALTGRHLSKETRDRIGEAQRGEKHHNFGKHRSAETKRKIGDASKKCWQDEEYIKKVLTARNVKPNKQEQLLALILSHLMPNEFGYNGDFRLGISIGRKIPDFVDVNGHKRIIELFGEPFHSPLWTMKRYIPARRRYNETIKNYKKYGYKCIVFWARDIDRPDAEAFVKRELKKVGWLK